MRESDSIVPCVIHMNIIIVRKQTQLNCHQNNLYNLNNKFIWKSSLGLPFFYGIHEKESQPSPHLVLRIASCRWTACLIRYCRIWAAVSKYRNAQKKHKKTVYLCSSSTDRPMKMNEKLNLDINSLKNKGQSYEQRKTKDKNFLHFFWRYIAAYNALNRLFSVYLHKNLIKIF